MSPTPQHANTQRDTARDLFRKKGLVRIRDLREAGIAPETVSRLVREGVALRVARGLYQSANAVPDAQRSLAEASAQATKGVICLTSALQFHGLTLQMPSAVWIAIDRSGWKPKIEYPPVRFVRFGERALKQGVQRHSIEGIEVPIFEPAKTIVDCFRYRNKIGLDVALEGLREGLQTKQATPDRLWNLARAARAWTAMRPYMETILSDGT